MDSTLEDRLIRTVHAMTHEKSRDEWAALQDMNDFSRMNAVYGEFFKPPYPARAAVQVARLPKDVKVEIEAIAVK